MNIVILAAGKGTRMKSHRPKVIHPIGSVPMVVRVVQAARQVGARKIIVVVGHQAEQVKALFESQSDILFVEQTEQLGTGHAVKVAIDKLDTEQPTLVLYGDVPLIHPESLTPLVQAAQQGAVGLLTQIQQDPSGYGRIVRSPEGRVMAIVEQKDATADQLSIKETNTGIVSMPTQALISYLNKLTNDNAQGEYYLTDIIAMASEQGLDIHTSQPGHDWEVLGVNSRVQQAELERTLQRHLANLLMTQGVELADPNRIDIRGALECGQDVSIDVNTVFEGTVQLGNNVSIGPNCYLKNVKLAEGVRIEAFSHLVDAVVGARSTIGPYARLRPGAQLADQVHIGNFVEVKKATIDSQSKVNHLSYVGDAKVGKRVNVGAGTITCNYDGVNKHLTEIGDDVFIGSDTQLVAPVKVENGATLGAGTTLTKTAPANSLTVSRSKQVTIEGWNRPTKKK